MFQGKEGEKAKLSDVKSKNQGWEKLTFPIVGNPIVLIEDTIEVSPHELQSYLQALGNKVKGLSEGYSSPSK